MNVECRSTWWNIKLKSEFVLIQEAQSVRWLRWFGWYLTHLQVVMTDWAAFLLVPNLKKNKKTFWCATPLHLEAIIQWCKPDRSIPVICWTESNQSWRHLIICDQFSYHIGDGLTFVKVILLCERGPLIKSLLCSLSLRASYHSVMWLSTVIMHNGGKTFHFTFLRGYPQILFIFTNWNAFCSLNSFFNDYDLVPFMGEPYSLYNIGYGSFSLTKVEITCRKCDQ